MCPLPCAGVEERPFRAALRTRETLRSAEGKCPSLALSVGARKLHLNEPDYVAPIESRSTYQHFKKCALVCLLRSSSALSNLRTRGICWPKTRGLHLQP